jgi:uncharacterized damage-inducible protein DinB
MATSEVWMRGPIDGFAPLLQPVAHSLLQVIEDLESLAGAIEDADLWACPGNAASLGFHIRHIAGATDRLLTYARGEALTGDQLAFLKGERTPDTATVQQHIARTISSLNDALAHVRTTPETDLLEPRKVGRAGLPSTTLGLLFHAAEHATRHAGQAITTAKILHGSPK